MHGEPATRCPGHRQRHQLVPMQAIWYTEKALNCYWTEKRHDSLHTDRPTDRPQNPTLVLVDKFYK